MNPSTRNEFFKYVSFNILGMLGISCYILADTFFIANGIGADGLAALNLAIPIYSFIHGSALMLGIGGATKFTIAKQQNEHYRADSFFTHSILTAVFVAAAFGVFGLFCSESLTRFLGADEILFPMTNIYLKVILLFAPFFIMNEVLMAYVRNDGAPALAMTAMVCGSLANIVLDYIFIYTFRMGILGAVLATGTAPIVSMLILIKRLKSKSRGFHMVKCPLQFKMIGDTAILGFPALVTEFSAGSVMIIINTLILSESGNIGIAAYGIIANIAIVTSAIFTGFAQGSQPLISSAHGKEDRDSIREYLRLSVVGIVVLALVLYAIIALLAAPIAALFNSSNDPQLQSMAEQGLVLYFTSLLFTGLNIILASFFTATDTPMPAHCISLLRGLLLVIPIAFAFAHLWGLNGIWLTVPVTELVTAVIAFLILKKHNKHQLRC